MTEEYQHTVGEGTAHMLELPEEVFAQDPEALAGVLEVLGSGNVEVDQTPLQNQLEKNKECK